MIGVAKERGCARALRFLGRFACGLMVVLGMHPAYARCTRLQNALAHEGVNLASGSFGEKDRLGDDYEYPTEADIDHFSARGLSLFRLPMKARRVLRPGAPDLGILDRIVEHARERGSIVVLDLHDYGYTASGRLIGRDVGATAEFVEQWRILATRYKTADNVMFGLMNEPHEQTPQEWLAAVNAAIDGIRSVGAGQRILVPGTAWSGAWTWISSGNAAALGAGVKDPANNFAFELHQYLDPNAGGATTIVEPGAGATRLAKATSWARENDQRLFLGEFGFASDEASLKEGAALLDFMRENNDVWEGSAFWAAGPGWGDYFFSVQPDGLKARPQMALLTKPFACDR